MSQIKATPMIRQYLSIKEQHADAILFYRMGDFYEMFFEDAEVASRVLDIALTSRNKNDDEPIPMCGVPHRAAQGYIARLIEGGHKVAVCDQVEDPAAARGIVRREVVRVVTPGMVLEDELLDGKTHNYLLSLFPNPNGIGLAYVDISTGTFRATESKRMDLILDEACRVGPREILLPQSLDREAGYGALRQALGERPVTLLADREFEYSRARNRLLDQFKTVSLEGFGLESFRAAAQAAGALLFYVQDNQKQPAAHLSGIETYFLDRFLIIDELSCRNLELLQNIRTGSQRGTFIEVIDRTVTAMGGRLLRQWVRYPLLDAEAIRARHEAVAEAKKDSGARRDIRELLKGVGDLERLGSKIVMGRANARDLTALKTSIQRIAPITGALARFQAPLLRPLEGGETALDLDVLDALAERIERTIREDAPPTLFEGGIIRSGCSPELDELIQLSRDGRGWLARLEAEEKAATGIASLKVRYNKVFGYYIEVPKTHSKSVPAHYVRKQTLVNAERYITERLKEFEHKVLSAEERRAALEYDLFVALREAAAEVNPAVQQAARFIGRLDCLVTLAEVADHNDYCRPEMTTDGTIRIIDGRHPVVEKMITGERFVPNSIHLDNEAQQLLINVARAIQFIRLHADDWNIDPERIAITGRSSGGHIAMMVGFGKDQANPESDDPVCRESSAVRCVIEQGGPTDLVPHMRALLAGGQRNAYLTARLQALLGIQADQVGTAEFYQQLKEISPISLVNKDTVPVLMLYTGPEGVTSRDDPRLKWDVHTPISGLILAEKLRQFGVDYELVISPDLGRGSTRSIATQAEFLMRYNKRP